MLARRSRAPSEAQPKIFYFLARLSRSYPRSGTWSGWWRVRREWASERLLQLCGGPLIWVDQGLALAPPLRAEQGRTPIPSSTDPRGSGRRTNEPPSGPYEAIPGDLLLSAEDDESIEDSCATGPPSIRLQATAATSTSPGITYGSSAVRKLAIFFCWAILNATSGEDITGEVVG